MLSTSLAAVMIALVIAIVAQLFYSTGVVTTDTRNVCLAAFAVWCAIASAVFVFGVFATLEVFFK